jgi:hypothetical protein
VTSFGRKRKRIQTRDPPGLFFLRMFIEDLENGEIPAKAKKVISVLFVRDALKAIVDNKIDPAEALCLIPSPRPGYFTRATAMGIASRDRVVNEVFSVWFFFNDHLTSVLKKEKVSGTRKSVVEAAAVKFSKSTRVIDRFFSAYKAYYTELLLITRDLKQLDDSEKLGKNEKWWINHDSVTERQVRFLNNVATTAFGRSNIKAKS